MGRHPKSGANEVNLTIKVPRDIYSKLRILAIEKNISHITLIEQMVAEYLSNYKHLQGLSDSAAHAMGRVDNTTQN